MKKLLMTLMLVLMAAGSAFAQTDKPYNEEIDPMAQIDQAIKDAKGSGKYVICQMGGNWCPWCLLFNKFIHEDAEVAKVIDDNFVYIHVNWARRGGNPELAKRLNNFPRFGFPVFVVLDNDGKVLHLQDSSFLEEGKGYNKDKTLRFFNNWTPKAVVGE